MLHAHPELAIPGESYFITELARNQYATASGFDTARFLSDLGTHPWYCRWDLDHEAVVEALTATPPSGYADAVRRVYATYAQAHGKARYGDKTPVYTARVKRLAALFPEARFVHIVRDGRDVAMSILELPEDHPTTMGGATLFWKRRVLRARQAGSTLGWRYLEVSYEALIEGPEPVLRKICDHIALDFSEQMLRDHTKVAQEILVGVRTPKNHLNAQRPITRGLRDWRSQMAPADVALFEALAGKTLEQYGYQLSGLRAARTRPRVAVTHLQDSLGHALFFGQLVQHRLRQRLAQRSDGRAQHERQPAGAGRGGAGAG